MTWREKMKTSYDVYKNTELWKCVKLELDSLVNNQDIKVTTVYDFVIGALVKKILEKFELKTK